MPLTGGRRGRFRVGIVVGSLLVAIGMVTGAVWLWNEGRATSTCPSSVSSNPAAHTLYLLEDCGATLVLPSHSFKAYQILEVSAHMTMYGRFVANGTVGTFVVNSTVISNFEAHPNPTTPPASFYWTCGSVSNCTLFVGLPPPPVQYYLVLENLNAQPLTIVWTEALTVAVISAGAG